MYKLEDILITYKTKKKYESIRVESEENGGLWVTCIFAMREKNPAWIKVMQSRASLSLLSTLSDLEERMNEVVKNL